VTGLGGVDTDLADYIRQADRLIRGAYPGVSLKVTSGFRSQAYQDALRARWDAGDRAGLVTRPALKSRHTEGRAVDLVYCVHGVPIPVASTPLSAFQWLGELLGQVGIRWSGASDPVHYEI